MVGLTLENIFYLFIYLFIIVALRDKIILIYFVHRSMYLQPIACNLQPHAPLLKRKEAALTEDSKQSRRQPTTHDHTGELS